jgi:DNA-binding CsgD family transcriptional regulator
MLIAHGTIAAAEERAMFDMEGGIPFDSLSVALCHGSTRRGAAGPQPRRTTDRAVHIAVAAWMAVVSESWDEAQELAQLSLHTANAANDDATGDALVMVCHGLVDIIALLRLGLPPNHDTLDRIALLLTATAGLDAAMESAEIFANIGAPFEQDRSHLVDGDLQDELRYRRDAAAHFDWAARTLAALGALPWERRARCGSSSRPCLEVPADPAWDRLLTEQERAVADAVVSGLSNVEAASQLFVSTKTIETHLTRIYRKFGLTSRTQLAAFVHRSTIHSANDPKAG